MSRLFSKRFFPFWAILTIAVVHRGHARHESYVSQASCAARPLDLDRPVTAWFGP